MWLGETLPFCHPQRKLNEAAVTTWCNFALLLEVSDSTFRVYICKTNEVFISNTKQDPGKIHNRNEYSDIVRPWISC
jgi:hypothetical protein